MRSDSKIEVMEDWILVNAKPCSVCGSIKYKTLHEDWALGTVVCHDCYVKYSSKPEGTCDGDGQDEDDD